MKINGQAWRSVWPANDQTGVGIIDQTRLPHELVTITLASSDAVRDAIANMLVRGAPLIGAVAAYGMALAVREDTRDASLKARYEYLDSARPTAVNLRWALDRMMSALEPLPESSRLAAAWALADEIADEDARLCAAIGDHGLTLIRQAAANKPAGEPVHILTHCNAGWLATVDYGTATAPIYKAHDEGINVHVWVGETRPRNQGAFLTAWELGQHGVPHTLVADNAGGHLMQHGQVDLCLVGSDRTTASGDVCNKIGTYLKALAAHDNDVPFYVALPSSTIDWTMHDGLAEVPIENRSADEVLFMGGLTDQSEVKRVRIAPTGTDGLNPAFDVTPARLVTGLITERGICAASRQGLADLFEK
ncbi:MAG: S-methyl-5-thioribose-1-phosphate isomerase [Burkholderiaceae bacterium]